MTKDIAPTASMPASGVVDVMRHAAHRLSGHRSPGSAQDQVVSVKPSDVGIQGEQAVSPSQAIDRALETAAREAFGNREIAVTSFRDEESGRFVHRITDLESGEVLMQSPPDELLRFFASGREMLDRPIVNLDV